LAKKGWGVSLLGMMFAGHGGRKGRRGPGKGDSTKGGRLKKEREAGAWLLKRGILGEKRM